MTTTISEQIETWRTRRTACLAREASEGASSRWADEIQSYDDEAIRLVALSAPVVAAAELLMDMDLDMWAMNATAFTCTESEAIAGLLAAVHGPDTADDFLHAHAAGDDEGDDHWHLNAESRTVQR